jgi:type VI secretion system protein ImpK
VKEASLETKTVSDLCTDIFLTVLRLKSSNSIGDFEKFHASIQILFQSFEKQCREIGLEADDTNFAKYALAAFVDEAVLNSSWPYRERWADNPLQLEYFGTYLAGENFYDKLEDLRARAESKPDLLEVYYLCLLLGFKGKYGVAGQEKLRSLIANVAGELSRRKPPTNEHFAPHWMISDGRGRSTGRLPRWIVLTCWGVVILALLLYLGLFFKIRRDADSLDDDIRNQTVSAVVVDEKTD